MGLGRRISAGPYQEHQEDTWAYEEPSLKVPLPLASSVKTVPEGGHKYITMYITTNNTLL